MSKAERPKPEGSSLKQLEMGLVELQMAIGVDQSRINAAVDSLLAQGYEWVMVNPKNERELLSVLTLEFHIKGLHATGLELVENTGYKFGKLKKLQSFKSKPLPSWDGGDNDDLDHTHTGSIHTGAYRPKC